MFGRSTPPISYIPPGYQADLDKYQRPGSPSCRRAAFLFLLVIGGIVGMCGCVMMTISQLAASMAVTPTLSPAEQITTYVAELDVTPTLTATLDYCWWLTPSPQPQPTLIPITPDAWGISGTLAARQTGTPTHTPTATTAPPRAWCDRVTPTVNVPTQAAIMQSPMPAPTDLPPLVLPTDRPAPIQQPAAPPNWSMPMPSYPTSQPFVPPAVVTVIVVQTTIPTAVPTSTPTPTPTATSTSTATATALPAISATGNCDMGAPLWTVTMANPPTDWVQYAITQDGVLIAADTWQPEQLLLPVTVSAPPGSGLYSLDIYQWWINDQVLSVPVMCLPTPTATSTLTPEPTWTPTLTLTPETTEVAP